MPAKLRRVRPPRWATMDWPMESTVQVGPVTGLRNVQTVYLDGVEVGAIESFYHVPRVPIPGTRLGKDLVSRKVWIPKERPGERRRIKYERLYDAVREVLKDHAAQQEEQA